MATFDLIGQDAALIANTSLRTPDYLSNDYTGPTTGDERRDLLIFLEIFPSEQKKCTDAELDALCRIRLQQKRDAVKTDSQRRAQKQPEECEPTRHLETAADVHFSKNEFAVLKALAESRTTMMQVELVDATDISSRKTISQILKRLRDLGLVHRPNGERGGEAITEAGRELVYVRN